MQILLLKLTLTSEINFLHTARVDKQPIIKTRLDESFNSA